MGGKRKVDLVAERVGWGAVAVACGVAVWTIYSWTDGDLLFRPSRNSDFWGWANAIIGLAALTALTGYGIYKAVFARSKTSN